MKLNKKRKKNSKFYSVARTLLLLSGRRLMKRQVCGFSMREFMTAHFVWLQHARGGGGGGSSGGGRGEAPPKRGGGATGGERRGERQGAAGEARAERGRGAVNVQRVRAQKHR